MPFEFVPERKGLYSARWSYTDSELEQIYKTKEDLEIKAKNELEQLKKIYDEVEAEYTEACAKRDAIVDWTSPEADEAEDAAQDLYLKLDAIENWIDWLEDLLNSLE